MQIYDLFVKTQLFKENTNDFIVKIYYNILIYYQPVLTLTSSLSPANRSDLPFSPDAEFESLSPSNLSDLPISPDPDFKPPSPANQSDLPVDDESSLAESPTAGQNLSNPLDISFQVINNCTNKGRPKLIDSRGFSYGIKCCRANATDWVCTIRLKVNIAN